MRNDTGLWLDEGADAGPAPGPWGHVASDFTVPKVSTVEVDGNTAAQQNSADIRGIGQPSPAESPDLTAVKK